MDETVKLILTWAIIGGPFTAFVIVVLIAPMWWAIQEKSTSGAEWLVAIYYGLPAFAYLYLLTLAPIPAIITGIYIYIFINSDKK